jgi:hypothetical protein
MKLKSTINPNTKTTLLYACKIGQPDYMEEILFEQDGYVNTDEVMSKGKEWAAKNGYDRLRLHVVDLSTPPDFAKTVNI